MMIIMLTNLRIMGVDNGRLKVLTMIMMRAMTVSTIMKDWTH